VVIISLFRQFGVVDYGHNLVRPNEAVDDDDIKPVWPVWAVDDDKQPVWPTWAVDDDSDLVWPTWAVADADNKPV
jgi:hypothetical protein